MTQLKTYSIDYGSGQQTFTLPENCQLTILKANTVDQQEANPDKTAHLGEKQSAVLAADYAINKFNESKQTAFRLIHQAISQPIGKPPLHACVKAGDKVTIITSDITRPCPSHLILPPLVDALNEAGIPDEDITVVFALGIHRPHTDAEKEKLIGRSLYKRVKTCDSNPDDTLYLGDTSLGTPVHMTRSVAQADRRICVGNIEYHYFAGYSGGAKALMPGVSNHEAIQANHRHMVEPTSCAGTLETNRLRMDIEEAGDLAGIDFIVNVVLDEAKNIMGVFAGDHRQAHRAGCLRLDQLYKVRIPKLADLVIATPGGLPKDLNLYQTQKALDNAKHAVKPGGIIILAGQCAEGFGEAVFESWLMTAQKADDLISRIKADFQLGGHKAAAIAMVLQEAQVYFVSDMPEEKAAKTFMKPYQFLSDAVREALRQLDDEATVIFMPHAGSTLPFLTC